MPSTIWTGSISFGLVTVPVRLTPATRSRDVSFHQLEAETGARIRYRRVSEQTGEEVSNDRIVKGYEVSQGRYVVFEPDELKALAPKSTRTIDIEDFVDLDDIDPIYFEQPYYVLPDKNAVKPYALLVRAMEELRKVAVGRVVIRSKEHLVAIRPINGLLCVETMRFADEVISIEELGAPDTSEIEISDRELAMAQQLVETLAAEWEPVKYHDEYREEVLGLIEAKAAGQEVVAEPEPEAPAKVLDLMSALQASLERAGRAGGTSAAADGAEDEEPASPARRRAGEKDDADAPAAKAKKPATRSKRSA